MYIRKNIFKKHEQFKIRSQFQTQQIKSNCGGWGGGWERGGALAVAYAIPTLLHNKQNRREIISKWSPAKIYLQELYSPAYVTSDFLLFSAQNRVHARPSERTTPRCSPAECCTRMTSYTCEEKPVPKCLLAHFWTQNKIINCSLFAQTQNTLSKLKKKSSKITEHPHTNVWRCPTSFIYLL